jgi:hypothetical protein
MSLKLIEVNNWISIFGIIVACAHIISWTFPNPVDEESLIFLVYRL